MSDGMTFEEIVEDKALTRRDSTELREEFSDVVTMLDEWAETARTIVVTDEQQTGDMMLARKGRLEIRAKRIAVERKHKEMKESSLKRGQALDRIKRFLVTRMTEIEEYLEKQEKFVELKRAAEEAERRAKADALLREQEEKERKEREAAEARQREADRKARVEAEAVAAKERKAREAAEAEARKAREAAEKERRAQAAAVAKAWKEIDENVKRQVEERLKAEVEQKRADEAKALAGRYIDIVFAGNDPANLVFIEIEDREKNSITVGEWVKRTDGFLVLRMPDPRGCCNE